MKNRVCLNTPGSESILVWKMMNVIKLELELEMELYTRIIAISL